MGTSVTSLYEVFERFNRKNNSDLALNLDVENDIKELRKTVYSLSLLACDGHVPKRYILFVLELIIFANKFFTKVTERGSTALSSVTMDKKVESAIPKSLVYALITQFELHMVSFNAERNSMSLNEAD